MRKPDVDGKVAALIMEVSPINVLMGVCSVEMEP